MGQGFSLFAFLKLGLMWQGLDLSADMLKIAEKRAASAKQKIDFIEGNMLDRRKQALMICNLLLGFYLLHAGRGGIRRCL